MADSALTEFYGRELLQFSSKKRQDLINKATYYWRNNGFPYLEFTKEEVNTEWTSFIKASSRFKVDKNIIGYTSSGLSLANSFHPQMWRIPSQGHTKSPITHFENDETLYKLLERAIITWPDRKCWRAYSVRTMFRVYAGGRVANFRPTVSNYIVNKLSSDKDTVLDFCAGFGGRLLGTMPLKRHYVGIDPSTDQVKGLKKMQSCLKKSAKCTVEILKGCAELIMPELQKSSFDLIFTSPPYFDLEKYGSGAGQSYMKYKSYENWKEDFLTQVVQESHRILKNNGILAINIADINGHPIAKDFIKIVSQRFKVNKQLQLVLNARPLQRSVGTVYRTEPVYICKKR